MGQNRSAGGAPPARPDSTALIVATADVGHRSFTEGIASLGRRSVTVHHPLEAIVCLQDDSLAVGVVLAPAHDLGFRTLELFEFMRDQFPRVRRIAYAKSSSEHAGAPGTGLIDLTLTYPTPLNRLAEALQPSPEAIRPATEHSLPPRSDQRTDEQLLHAWNGSDRPAFDELDRRYRPRIRALATSLRFTDEDADDIVQETLLGLYLSRGVFRG
jgi:hypothetical protein